MTGVPGKGLVSGLGVTLRAMTRRSVTAEYPDVEPELPPRSRGVIALFEENCTVCMLCARECPDWCIYIDSHKETLPAPEGGRPRVRNVLDRFAIDFSLCMYCGICIEVCPFDALFWTPEFAYAEGDISDLTHERDRLRDWMWTVPEPPALDPGAEPAKEVGTAEKALARPVRPARPAAGGPAAPRAAAPSAAPPAGARSAAPPAGDPRREVLGKPSGTRHGSPEEPPPDPPATPPAAAARPAAPPAGDPRREVLGEPSGTRHGSPEQPPQDPPPATPAAAARPATPPAGDPRREVLGKPSRIRHGSRDQPRQDRSPEQPQDRPDGAAP